MRRTKKEKEEEMGEREKKKRGGKKKRKKKRESKLRQGARMSILIFSMLFVDKCYKDRPAKKLVSALHDSKQNVHGMQ